MMPAGDRPPPNPLSTRRRALIVIALLMAVGPLVGGVAADRRSPPPPIAMRVDPNTAPVGVLEALPRIGPAMAGRIVEAREDRPIADLGDFDRRIKGVGPVTLDALRPHLRFDGDPRPPTKDR